MPEDKIYSIWCLIDGESQPFTILAKVDDNVDDLKRAIRLESPSLRGAGPSGLLLWKVCSRGQHKYRANSLRKLNSPILIRPVVDLTERIQFPNADLAVALEEPTLKVSEIFAQCPSKEHLYIIVKRSGACEINHGFCMQTLMKSSVSSDSPTSAAF